MLDSLGEIGTWIAQGCSSKVTILWILYLGLIVAIVSGICIYWCRTCRNSWYDAKFETPIQPSDWEKVRSFMEHDPLETKKDPVWGRFIGLFAKARAWLVALSGILAASSLALGIGAYGCGLTTAHLQNLGVAVGGLGFVAGAYGVYYQGKVRARAEHRQQWINALRSDISKFLALLEGSQPDSGENGLAITGRIALYLNPSEPVHRAFLALARALSDPSKPVFQEDQDLLTEIGLETVLRTAEERGAEIEDLARHRLVRLANVLLKREWEQVKYVR